MVIKTNITDKYKLGQLKSVGILGGNPRFRTSTADNIDSLVIDKQDTALLMACNTLEYLISSGKMSTIFIIVDHIASIRFFLRESVSPNRRSYRLTELNTEIITKLLENFSEKKKCLILEHTRIYFERKLRQQMSGIYDKFLSKKDSSKNNFLNSIGVKISSNSNNEEDSQNCGNGCNVQFKKGDDEYIKIRCKAIAARAYCLVASDFETIHKRQVDLILGFWNNSKWCNPYTISGGANLARMLMDRDIKTPNIYL